MQLKQTPLVSIITPTLNAAKYLPHFLESLRQQTYPRKRLEILISDGGSTDDTRKIAKKYGAKIIDNPYIQAQPGVYVGMKKAKGELLITLPGDNIFVRPDALLTLVDVLSNKNIYAAFPKHASDSSDSLFTKYINTFTDPFNHFLYGYAANARTFHKVYKVLLHTTTYDVYDFTSSSIKPILGVTQGFIVRKEFVKHWEKKYDDIHPILFLINNRKRIAYVYSVDLLHHTVRDIGHFFRKQRWSVNNALRKHDYGLSLRMKSLTGAQHIKMYLYIPYGLSIVFPVLRSIWGFIKDGQILWLFHPVITLISVIAILYEYVLFYIGRNKEVSRL